MSASTATIIIPTRNRPELLPRAVASALSQSVPVEVIVVDDASDPPAHLPPDPRLRVLRLERHVGGSAARNVGLGEARARWIAFLDDDDVLLPHMIQVSLEAVANSHLPEPVAALSGIEVVDSQGHVLGRRLPTSRRRGEDFFLEEPEPGRTYLTKQTLFVEAEVLRELGGFDESFRSRVHSELFLRLNRVCSLEAASEVTYRLSVHEGHRVSSDPHLRQESVHRLLEKHAEAFARHARRAAEFVLDHAARSKRSGQNAVALRYVWRAFRFHPGVTMQHLGRRILSR